jgi:hypothetical protein
MENKRQKPRMLNHRLLRVLAADERERMQEDQVRTDGEIERPLETSEESTEETFSFQRADRRRVIEEDSDT